MAPAPAIQVIQPRRRQMTRTPSSRQSAPATTWPRTRPSSDDRAGAPAELHWPPARPAWPNRVGARSCRSRPRGRSWLVAVVPRRSVVRSRRWWRRIPVSVASRSAPMPAIASLARRTQTGPRSTARPRVGEVRRWRLPAAPRSPRWWRPVRRCAPAGVRAGGPGVGRRRQLSHRRRPNRPAAPADLPHRGWPTRGPNSAPSIPGVAGCAWCQDSGGWHRCLLDNGVHIGARHAIRHRAPGVS